MNWTIGTDVEFCLEKNGKLVSAVPLLPPDDKADKLPHGTVFHDNVLAEFTIKPANSKDEFVQNILANIKALTNKLAPSKVKLKIVSSARYSRNELNSSQAKIFGCSPDFDAYELIVNQVAFEADETDLRTAGGHIHVAHPVLEDPYKIIEMIKLMDLFLGVPSILKDSSSEAKERRNLYGKAGAHRPKNYPGCEYRTLSNFWVKDKKHIEWAYNQTQRCLELLLQNETVTTLGFDEQEIRRIVNEADGEAAKAIGKILNETN